MIHLDLFNPSLTSSLPNNVLISQVTDYVICSININYTEVYRTTLYEKNGYATFYDLRAIVEDYMIYNGLSEVVFSMEVEYEQGGGGEMTQEVCMVYSSIRPLNKNDENFLASEFLTTRRCITAPRGYPMQLLYFTDIQDDYKAVFDCRLLRNGEIKECVVEYPIQSPQGPDVYALQADSDFVTQLCAEALELENPGKLLSAAVRIENRHMTIYYTEDKPIASFFFRNAFNAWEYLHLVGKDIMKTDISRKEAVCQGVTSYYDQTVNKKHVVETCPLTQDEAAWFNEFLTSRTVRLVERRDNENFDVFISDITSEIQADAAEPTVIKFSWRLADNADWRKQEFHPQIFNDTYNPTFQ